MRNREINHHINTHTQLVARLARCRRGRDRHYGVTELPSSGTWPPRLRYAPWCLRPPARTAGGASTRSRHGATCTGTTPGAPWASTRSSAAAAPGAATATTRQPAAAPAAWPPRSPAESAADPDGTCSRPSKTASREAREDTSERSPCCVAYKEAEASEWNGTCYSGVLRVVVVAAAVVRGWFRDAVTWRSGRGAVAAWGAEGVARPGGWGSRRLWRGCVGVAPPHADPVIPLLRFRCPRSSSSSLFGEQNRTGKPAQERPHPPVASLRRMEVACPEAN
nr:unnamed protein product [Digitaria exilis]